MVSLYRGGSSWDKVAAYHLLRIAGFIGEIEIRAHKSLCKGLCDEIGRRNNVAIAECVESLSRDIREQVVHVIGHLVTEISNAPINEP